MNKFDETCETCDRQATHCVTDVVQDNSLMVTKHKPYRKRYGCGFHQKESKIIEIEPLTYS